MSSHPTGTVSPVSHASSSSVRRPKQRYHSVSAVSHEPQRPPIAFSIHPKRFAVDMKSNAPSTAGVSDLYWCQNKQVTRRCTVYSVILLARSLELHDEDYILPARTSSMPPKPTSGRGSTRPTKSLRQLVRSSSCSTSTMLFFRRMIRRSSNRQVRETVEALLNSKSKPENLDERDVVSDRGEVDDVVQLVLDDRESGPIAVFNRRRP